ncbi:CRTAC1 family protein [Paracrocinitomix mangrovi]|uniref:CRTAC1 family protein n=1 Tax=Paracrocinitomix mangrovi TaxID=2862509 RepID=UPI001C8E0216|nr:CRTAC1 family protein [Paracrocinitomix mangrovi]UKN02384.1 CRTAC1 family protein [Paracrocinitomix mangrovi]
MSRIRIVFIVLFFLPLLSANAQDFDMKKELARLSKLDTFPDNYGFTNSMAIPQYKMKIANTSLAAQKQQLYYELSWQYLFAGYPDSALVCMDNIPYQVWINARKNNPNYDKEFMMGLAYMRKGEQQNCQDNHNSFSCIMPLNEQAQHIKKEGSEKAIEMFKLVLDRSPDHYTARWLMNVAYMTLGKYPDEVPQEYYIDFQKFPQDSTTPYFQNIAGELGVNTLTFYGGTVVEDFNNDGFLDIFTSSGDLKTNVELYLADGKGGFHRHTDHAGLKGITGGGNLTHADYNNDGYADIYVIRGGWLGPKIGRYHPNSLLRNNGDGTFTDVTEEVGLLAYYPSHTASFADFNNDGWLDLFVGNENGYSQLFQNNNGEFKDVSARVGMYVSAFVKGSYWGDYDNDGYQDLYISVSRGDNLLFHNEGPNESGEFKFINKAEEAGVKSPYFSFPTFFFDFNNDGFLDIFCASYPSDVARLAHQYITDTVNIQYSSLYINQQNGTFKDIAVDANLNRSIEAMGLNFGDIDNDGWLDFYVGTGFPAYEALIPNLMFRNNNGEHFLEVYQSGFSHLQKGHGIGFGDMDNDGDQDLYVSLGGFMESDQFWNMFLVNPGNDNNWITLDLEGVTSNKDGIGAQITVITTNGKEHRGIHRRVTPGGSFGSSSLQQEIGLGKCDETVYIKVYWPASNTFQEFTNVEVDKTYKIVEGKKKLKELKRTEIEFNLTGGQEHHHHH